MLYDALFFGFGRLNDQIYFFYNHLDDDGSVCDFTLHVFEGQDTTKCTKVIPLPKVMDDLLEMTTCKQSNSMYVWQDYSCASSAVLHLVPDGNGGFEVLHWPTCTISDDFRLLCSKLYYC